MPITNVTLKGVGKIEDKDERAKAAYNGSVSDLGKAIEILSGDLSEEQSKLLNHYFCHSVLRNEIEETILPILRTTLQGLTNNAIVLEIGFYNYASNNKELLNLAVQQFKNPDQAVRYLIHEATHANAKTKDHMDRGYINNDGNFREAGLTGEEALKNADSYACLVVGLAGRPLIS